MKDVVAQKVIINTGPVMWEVLVEIDDPNDVPVLCSMRVMDPQYRPVGPNLVGLLDLCLIMTPERTEASEFLGFITELVQKELECPKKPLH